MSTPASDAPSLDEFRARCSAFLEEHATGVDLGGDPDPRTSKSIGIAREFQQKLAAAGLAGITYPKEYGGLGLGKEYEAIWREEYAKFPMMTGTLAITHGMCLPMLAEYGTHEQKERFLAKCISAEEYWCQMFSEPGAGSDVASLQTRAVRDGDEWILNGQKVWTTWAHECEYGIIIARTDPDQPKHAGITMFIVDLRAAGVEIRPIHQIDGGMHFNEIFFTDVRVPAEWQVGDLNNGWRLATAMLMYERVAIGTGSTGGVSRPRTDSLVKLARKTGKVDDPVVRQELMRICCAEMANSLVSLRTRAEAKAGKTPGPGGSIGKLAGTLIAYEARDLSMQLLGATGLAWDDPGSPEASWARQAVASMSSGIAGGTNEIQRNIIGERVLGLPREPSADKGVPFKDLAVGTLRS